MAVWLLSQNSFFRGALPITNKIICLMIKAKDQITWSHICFYIHRGLDGLFILIIKDFKNRWKDWVMLINNKVGCRTISPEENCPQTLKLILTQNQTMTLTEGQFSSGSIVLIPIKGSDKGSRKKRTNIYS